MRVPSGFISLTTKMILKVQPITHFYLRQWKERASDSRSGIAQTGTGQHCSEKVSLRRRRSLRTAGRRSLQRRDHFYRCLSDHQRLSGQSLRPQHIAGPARFPRAARVHAAGHVAGIPDYRLLSFQTGTGRWRLFERADADVQGSSDASFQLSSCTAALTELASFILTCRCTSMFEKTNVCRACRRGLPDTKMTCLGWPGMNLPPVPAQQGDFLHCFTTFQSVNFTELVADIKKAYFPWVQGLHILLDYLIDQEEDRAGLDLNFCTDYENNDRLSGRISHFYNQAQASVASLPDAYFII